MSSQQKRGFRLPWGADRGPEAAAATLDGSTDPDDGEPAGGEMRDDLGDGPFRLVDTKTPDQSTDDAPAASDVPESAAEAEMMETTTHADTATETAAATNHAGDAAWPEVDRAALSQPAADDGTAFRPAIHAASDVRPARRENPLVAGLVKAMREAAIASREETSTKLRGEAEARVEAIRGGSAEEATALRKRADDDVTAIREWSKAEIARLRQETDERIEARRVQLTTETERHAAGVERQVEEVQRVVAAVEADMDVFFERLLAENDPARLATLAEQAPDAPDLADLPNTVEWLAVDHAAEGADPDAPAALEAAAAAEAEAEASEGLEMADGQAWPAALIAAARRGDSPDDDADGIAPDDVEHSRLLVNGLTSVAAISAFKGAVGQLPGVHAVSVSSGERGVFVFTVSHDADADISAGVAALPGFAASVTDEAGDSLSITAHEPAA